MSRLEPLDRVSPRNRDVCECSRETLWERRWRVFQRSSADTISGAVKASQRAGGSIPLLDCRFASDAVFHHACAMGLEGIVAKRRDRPYRSGRSPDWIKVKNPDAPAANRLIEG